MKEVTVDNANAKAVADIIDGIGLTAGVDQGA
jgi:hypothetical protein